MSKRQTWRSYLSYLKRRAHRKALKQARQASHTSMIREMVDGQGETQLEYVALTPQAPWSAEDLARYEALENGGEWEPEK